ncbi:hypothetical protein PTKIN_Ptkin13bG0020700 [Pterospermum kingtungense]
MCTANPVYWPRLIRCLMKCQRSTMISGYAMQRSAVEAFELFGLMRLEDEKENRVWNALVTMYAKCGSLDDALKTFELSGDKNSITWSAMITGYAQNEDSLKALKLF